MLKSTRKEKPSPFKGLGLELAQGMDVYLLDLLLRSRISLPCRVLDVGSGTGRNLPIFYQTGCTVLALDLDSDALQYGRERCDELPKNHKSLWAQADISQLPSRPGAFDLVIVNAVLHFAPTSALQQKWFHACSQACAPGGLLFFRMATDAGMGEFIHHLPNGQTRLPAGEIWTLFPETLRMKWLESEGLRELEPFKTVLIPGKRSMAIWVLQKR